jgi:HAE1 family hydrophobic/amphiphilic exporter-1
MEGIDQMQSLSFEGMSMIIVSFTYGTASTKPLPMHKTAFGKACELPRDILAPTISKISVDEKTILISLGSLEP